MVQIDAPETTSTTPPDPAAPPPADPPNGDSPVASAHARPPMVAGSDPVDSQEITQSDLLDEDDIASSAGLTHANGGFSTAAPPVEPDARRRQAARGTESTDDQGVPADWQTSTNWASESTRKFRQRLFLGIAIAGALLVVAILVMWSVSGSKSPPTIAENSQQDQNAGPENPVSTNEKDAATDPSPNTPDTAPQDPADAPTSEAEQSEQTTPDAADDATQSPPKTTDPNADAVIPADLLPIDVLAGLDDDTTKHPKTNNTRVVPGRTDEPAADPLTDLPPELASFVDLLNLPGNAPDAPPVIQATALADDLVIDQAADAMLDPMLLATPPPDVNINNALKMRIAIQTDGYPLASFVLVCSEATQVPIQIDWFTLDLAGISISKKVRDPKPSLKPIDSLMDAIASEAGVVFEQEKTRVLLTLAIADARARMNPVLDTEDFGTEQESAKTLVDQFANDPQWNEREQLNLRALVTDCLRLARGLDAKLPESAISHWTIRANALRTKEDAANPPLKAFTEQWPLVEDGESGPQLDTAITLAGLLRRTSQVNQVACVVNWDDARQRRLTPGQLVLPYADQPAGQMLAKTLAPMGLQARVADAKHWWVGTAATYDRMPLLVIGDELGPRREEILTRIREAAEHADTAIFIAHDPVSDRYLSMMPRFLYRQLPAILRPFSE